MCLIVSKYKTLLFKIVRMLNPFKRYVYAYKVLFYERNNRSIYTPYRMIKIDTQIMDSARISTPTLDELSDGRINCGIHAYILKHHANLTLEYFQKLHLFEKIYSNYNPFIVSVKIDKKDVIAIGRDKDIVCTKLEIIDDFKKMVYN